MLDSIYYRTLRILKNRIYGVIYLTQHVHERYYVTILNL